MFHQTSSRTARRGVLIGVAGAAVAGCFSVCPGVYARVPGRSVGPTSSGLSPTTTDPTRWAAPDRRG